VEGISGGPGAFKARIKLRPRYVTGEGAIDDSIVEGLSAERDNDFNLKMGKTKALYLPHDMAWPHVQVLDREALSDADAEALRAACPPGTLDLDMKEQEIEVDVGAVIVATVVERLAAPGGPTGGEILRPSDGKKPRNVAFVQCAGSRDENHLPYCSAVCCLGSLKQVRYLREADENTRATVFYIDIRTIGRLEKFYYDMLDDENVAFIKGKVARISEDTETRDLVLDVEDTLSRENLHERFDLVVLATGIVPNTADARIPFELTYDEYGFIDGATDVEGVYAAGCTKQPCDVSRSTKDATAAALKAIQCLNKGQ
jgi:quinone-modifying oxidoreductase subunit QmoA